MEIKFDWKNFKHTKPEFDRLVIFKQPFGWSGFCSTSPCITVYVLGRYVHINDTGVHVFLGNELIIGSLTKHKKLAYHFSENPENTHDQLDFEWDYYNWPNL